MNFTPAELDEANYKLSNNIRITANNDNYRVEVDVSPPGDPPRWVWIYPYINAVIEHVRNGGKI